MYSMKKQMPDTTLNVTIPLHDELDRMTLRSIIKALVIGRRIHAVVMSAGILRSWGNRPVVSLEKPELSVAADTRDEIVSGES